MKNDVVTFDPALGSVEPFTVFGGWCSRGSHDNSVRSHKLEINSGTYNAIHTGTGSWLQELNGNIDVVINDATLVAGVISIGPMFHKDFKDYICADQYFKISGKYNVTINGGTYKSTAIIIGAEGMLNTGRKNQVRGSDP